MISENPGGGARSGARRRELTKQSVRATMLRWLIALRMLISLSRLSRSLLVSFWRDTALIATGVLDFCW